MRRVTADTEVFIEEKKRTVYHVAIAWLQAEEIEDKSTGRKYKKETMIFPRYHQLDAVRRLSRDAREINNAAL